MKKKYFYAAIWIIAAAAICYAISLYWEYYLALFIGALFGMFIMALLAGMGETNAQFKLRQAEGLVKWEREKRNAVISKFNKVCKDYREEKERADLLAVANEQLQENYNKIYVELDALKAGKQKQNLLNDRLTMRAVV